MRMRLRLMRVRLWRMRWGRSEWGGEEGVGVLLWLWLWLSISLSVCVSVSRVDIPHQCGVFFLKLRWLAGSFGSVVRCGAV